MFGSIFRSAAALAAVLILSTTAAGAAAIGEVARTLTAPAATPTGIAYHGGSLWVADWETGALFEIDPVSGAVRQEVAAPCYHPEGLASDGTRLYISDYETARIYLFDPRTGSVLRSYPSPEKSPKGLAYGGGSLWLVDDGIDQIYELVPDDGTILNYYKAPHANCRGMTHDGRRLWVSDRNQDEIYALVPADGAVLFLTASPGPYPNGLAVVDKVLWVADFQERALHAASMSAGTSYRVSQETTRDFRFRYAMRNDGEGRVTAASIHIAVPYGDLPQQKTLGAIRWTPAPTRFDEDRWGQKVAVFAVDGIEPGARVEVGYETRVRIGSIRYAFYPEDVGKLEEIPKEIRDIHTTATTRLQLDREEVRKTARTIVGDEKNPYWMARKIYDWVRESLEYDRVGGWDVPTTLIKRGTGSCSEYAFLYIALCRSVGLPARYEGSVSQRGDDASIDDVFHRWCEVYLPRIGWVPIDPSGGDQHWPADQARFFGGLANRYIITTRGGGDSEYLGWTYNAHAVHTYEGRGSVAEEAFGIWSAVGAEEVDETEAVAPRIMH